jgi:hypothetical protein
MMMLRMILPWYFVNGVSFLIGSLLGSNTSGSYTEILLPMVPNKPFLFAKKKLVSLVGLPVISCAITKAGSNINTESRILITSCADLFAKE